MCLYKITNPAPAKHGVGYKIFDGEMLPDGILRGHLIWTDVRFQVGVWHEDPKGYTLECTIRDSPYIQTYKTGYHLYKYLDDARFTNCLMHNILRVYEIEYDDAVAEGLEVIGGHKDKTVPVIVARKVKPIKDVTLSEGQKWMANKTLSKT